MPLFSRKKSVRHHQGLLQSLPSRVWLSTSLIEATPRHLRSFWDDDERHEGIVYWAGIETENDWFITTAIRPSADTTWGSYRTSVSSNAEVVLAANGHHLHVLGQVHSHPDEWVDHSAGDLKGAFMPFEGFLSIVVPYYASEELKLLDGCGIHRFEHGRFRRLAGREVDELIGIVPVEISINE